MDPFLRRLTVQCKIPKSKSLTKIEHTFLRQPRGIASRSIRIRENPPERVAREVSFKE